MELDCFLQSAFPLTQDGWVSVYLDGLNRTTTFEDEIKLVNLSVFGSFIAYKTVRIRNKDLHS